MTNQTDAALIERLLEQSAKTGCDPDWELPTCAILTSDQSRALLATIRALQAKLEKTEKDWAETSGQWQAQFEDQRRRADTAEAKLAEAEGMRRALIVAGKQFRKYEALHKDKGSADGDTKAAVNASMAAMCEAALNTIRKGDE